MSDVEYAEYEAPKQPEFFSFPVTDTWYKITFVKKLADSDQFEVGPKGKKKPAHVWLIEENGTPYRWTLTSSRLLDAISKVKEAHGDRLEGVTAEFMPIGNDKERTFRVRWIVNRQGKLNQG